MTRRLAAYSAGQPPGTASAAAIADSVSPAATVYRARRRRPGQRQHRARVNHVRVGADDPPVRRVQGRPAAAHPQRGGDAGQGVTGLHDIPRPGPAAATASSAGTAPLWTPAGPVISLVVLLAVRMFALGGRPGRHRPAATTTITTMLPQANTTHADFVHTRTVLSLSFHRGSAPDTAGPDTEGTNRSGRKATYAGGTSGR